MILSSVDDDTAAVFIEYSPKSYEFITEYVFVFGDNDMYDPNDGMTSVDWECDSEKEAWDWFQDYTGFGDEDDL